MIKGHYIATVVIEAKIPEDTPGLKPFDQIKEKWEKDLTNEIQEALRSEFGEPGVEISVSKRYSHLYKSEDKA